MTPEDLKKKYKRLVQSSDFDELELGLENPNIFQILKIAHYEIRHSTFLAWLLDANESHKLGDIFLKRFLREVFSSPKFSEINSIDAESIDLTKVQVLREWKNIDILIILPNVVVCIENKVHSTEHSNQLAGYKKIIENDYPKHEQVFVYLTPDGQEPENEKESYAPISYAFIVELLDKIISSFGESINKKVANYINDYSTTIKQDIMETGKMTELAKKIYQNHKEIFDFISDHKPDDVDDFRNIMLTEVKKRGWLIGSPTKRQVRFLTPDIKDLIYTYKTRPNKNDWPKHESFLFEIVFSSKNLSLKTVISPADDTYNALRLEKIIKELDIAKPSQGDHWLVNISKTYGFNIKDIYAMPKEEATEEINRFLDEITDTVQLVETKLLEHKDVLIQMKKDAEEKSS